MRRSATTRRNRMVGGIAPLQRDDDNPRYRVKDIMNAATRCHIAVAILSLSRKGGRDKANCPVALAGVALSRDQFALLNGMRNTDIFFMGPKKIPKKKATAMFKGRLPIGRMMSASYVRIVKADEKAKKPKNDRTQVGYSALGKYMEGLLDKATSGEIDAYGFYTRILFANNYLLGHALGMKTDDDFKEMTTDEGDELPSLLHEPIYTPSVALWMKRLTGGDPQLKEVMEEDEELNGSLDEALKSNRGIRSDISKFLAEPYNDGRAMKTSEMKGIYTILSRTSHPISESLYHAIDGIGDGVLEQPPPRKQPTRGRVRVTDPSYTEEVQQARGKQKEIIDSEYRGDTRMRGETNPETGFITGASGKYDDKRLQEAESVYGSVFDETNMGSRNIDGESTAQMSFKTPSTATTKKFIDYLNRQVQTSESTSRPEEYTAAGQKVTGSSKKTVTLPQAFDELQDKLNQYMIALTGEKAWGTGGGKQHYGGDYGTPRAPSIMTPSLFAAGKQLGLHLNETVNTPDGVLSPWWKGKDPTSNEVRDDIAYNFDIEDGMHISLKNALSEGGVLDTVLDKDKVTLEETGMAQGSSKEERGAKAAEAGTKGATTQSSLMSEEDELKHIEEGNESRAGRIKVKRETADLERLLNTGQISDREYQLRRLHKDSISQFDSEKIMNGLEGRDFGKDHAFYGKSGEDIAELTSGFVDNLIGMGRLNQTIKNLVVKGLYGNETEEDRRAGIEKFKELKLTSDDYLDMMDYFDYETPTPQLKDDQKQRFNKLSKYIGRADVDAVLGDYATSMNKRMKRFKELGLTPSQLMEASLRYSGEDMTKEGFTNALYYLNSKVQGGDYEGQLSEFATNALLKHLEQQGRRAARNEEHHQKLVIQKDRFSKNRLARGELEAKKARKENEEEVNENKDIIHDKEDCRGCHHSRFMTGDAETAKENAPWDPQRKKTPFTQKMMKVPMLKKYRDAETRQIKDMFLLGGNSSQTSLSTIADFIFPDEGYSFKEMNERQSNVKNKSKWADTQKRILNRKIKTAVATGNPRAQAIFKKFGIFGTGENTIASGSAGYSNKELAASAFLMPSSDAHDKHHEKARLQTLNALRYDAMLNAMDLLRSFSKGEIPDETGKGRKVSLSALKSGNGRQGVLDRVVKLPNKSKARKTKNLRKAQDELTATQEAFDNYQRKLQQLEADEEKTKPVTVMEDGVKRTYPGEYSSPVQLDILKNRRKELNDRYKPMLTARKRISRRIQKHQGGLKELEKADSSLISRYDDYALGAFMHAGGYIVDAMKRMDEKTKELDSFKRWDDDARKVYYDRSMLEELSKLIQVVYPEDDDTILQGDILGRVTRDYQHAPSKYKMGRVGEMLGTGVQHFSNNKALPRPNDMMQLRALRLMKGHDDLSEEEMTVISNILDDSAYASTMDDELMDLFGLDDDVINHTTAISAEEKKARKLEKEILEDPRLYDINNWKDVSKPKRLAEQFPSENPLQLLTEEEARKRHHNSHFTQGAVEEIKKGNISADLISNWEDKAPTLCGTCHGHGHISRGGAASFIRNHVAGYEDESADSKKINKYIEKKMRPRDSQSWEHHEMSDEMEAKDHEQLACPDCEHHDPTVIGGKISNGLCSHCFSSGVRDPESTDEHHGYIDQDGNVVQGAKHNKHFKGKMSGRVDALNEIMHQLIEYRTGEEEVPDYLKEIIGASTPISLPHIQYKDWLATGKGVSTRDLHNNRKESKLTQPLPPSLLLDEEDEPPPPPPPGGDNPIESALAEIERKKREEGGYIPGPSNRYGRYGTATSNPQANVHTKLMDAHIDKMLKQRVFALQKMANRNPDYDEEEVQMLVNEILQHPHIEHYHNDEDHPVNDMMHKLQRMAESTYATDLPKESQFPMDEDGNFGFSRQQFAQGKSPLAKKEHSSLIFAHGRFLTPEEYHEGLFDPATPHKRPKEPTFADLVRHYEGNDEANRLLGRFENTEKFKQEDMDKLMEVIKDPIFTDKNTGEQRPMERVKTTGIESEDLNRVLREFGMDVIKPTDTGNTPRWSKEFKNKITESGLSMSKVNGMLNMPNRQKQPRGMDDRYNTTINKAIKPMWNQYLKMNALKYFIENKLNKLDYPNLNDGVTLANFSQITRDDNTQEQFYDEAAAILGFEDEADMDKKLKMNKKMKIGNTELHSSDFKKDVLRNATVSPQEDEEYGRSSLPIVGFNNGKKLKVLHVNNSKGKDDVSKHITDTRESMFTDEENKKHEVLKNLVLYDRYPNWMSRETIEDILHGDENEDGIDFSELQRLYKEHDLPTDTTDKLDSSKMYKAVTHPSLATSATNYDESLQFDHAQQSMHEYNVQREALVNQEAVRQKQLQAQQAQLNAQQQQIAAQSRESIS